MEIPEPPASDTGLEKIIPVCVAFLNEYFGPRWGDTERGGKTFEDYETQFEWFAQELSSAQRVLNVACYYRRETFALMWYLRASDAIGIDVCAECIELVGRKVLEPLTTLGKWVNGFLGGQSGSGLTPDYRERLRNWWQNEVPHGIRSAAIGKGVPSFMECDIADAAEVQEKLRDGFDLVYCRHLLDGIAYHGGDLKTAITNIAGLVAPETGRIVVVGATQRVEGEPKHGARFVPLDELATWFRSQGLTLIKTEETSRLGYLDWPESRPGGLILARQRATGNSS